MCGAANYLIKKKAFRPSNHLGPAEEFGDGEPKTRDTSLNSNNLIKIFRLINQPSHIHLYVVYPFPNISP